MNIRFVIALLFFITSQSYVFGQDKLTCDCSDSLDLPHIQYCTPFTLKTGEKLYYQYDCDTLWLTLERENTKTIIFSEKCSYYENSYEKPYLFITEFDKYILFARFCNPTCTHYLVEKATGKVKEIISKLIFDGSLPNGKTFDIVISFVDDNYDKLQIYRTNTDNKTYNLIKKVSNPIIYPESSFNIELYKWKNNILWLGYKDYTKKRSKVKYIKVKLHI
ncbi:MAG: hypothetical protein EAZ95_00080 [Bacteroidetes bacterium]|nr:MAG: hypothetical protein EAZ95_00080 [Bacteroidota bacterium]